MKEKHETVDRFSSKIKDWFTNVGNSIGNWAKNLKPAYWINIACWLITFVMLIAIIIVAAMESDITISFSKIYYSNVMASLALVFSIFLMGSIIHIVVIKMIEKKKGVA